MISYPLPFPTVYTMCCRFLMVLCAEEKLTLDNFLLLNENYLTELGFTMGPRKQLISWIRSQKVEVTDSSSISVSVPSIAVSAGTSVSVCLADIKPSNSRFVYSLVCLPLTVHAVIYSIRNELQHSFPRYTSATVCC